ncbi:ankyrin repeat-containing protein, putative [Babesia caballi]|uniref:Ankyrin repeat-containing protein, putative n=1 Tax=Babesia caballi TaxID=5871 RepID=A0AAV4LM84_BABCB|nr:ankyrin repeat-containing protein, putative [Babesia caballi]
MTLHIDVAESSGGRSDKASKGTQNANTFESTSHRAGSTDEATTSVHLENNVEISEAGNIVKGSFKEGIILQQDSCKEQRDFKMQPSKNAESQNTQRSRSKVAKSRLMGESMRPGSTRDDNVGGSPGSSYPITVTNAPIYLTPDQNMRARLRGKSDGHTPENRNTSQSDRKCQTPLQHAERAGSEGNNVFHREAEGPRITSRGAPENEKWKYIVTKLEPFLDVHSLLMLRQTCVVLHRHKYTINPNNELCFRGFVGFDIDFVLDKVFPLVTKVLRIKEDAKLRLDFSQCYNFRDMSVVRMLTTQAMLNNDTRTQRLCRNMRSLVLDFCPQLTDQGLAVMLATRLPNLEKLSIVCCRNQALTGAPFVKSLSTECWPSFKRFNCNFSNITLEPIQAVAQFILRAAGGIAKGMSAEVTARSASWEADGAESERSWCTLGDLEPNSEVKQYVEKCYVVPQLVGAATALCQLDVIGSWGSRSFLDRQGFAPELQAFAKGVKMRAKKLCSKLTKRVQRRLEDSGSAASANGDALLVLLAQRGSELLVNCPIIEHDSHNAMNVWTLPISIAIESDDMDMCNLLIRRGARVSVWDYCGKSPLYKACEMSRTAFVRLLLKLGQAPQPLESSLSPMAVCIKNGNTFYLEQLLKVGAQINMRCPHVRNFKSPLYIACEANNKECIEMLLKSGADTNWVYHGRRVAADLPRLRSRQAAEKKVRADGRDELRDLEWRRERGGAAGRRVSGPAAEGAAYMVEPLPAGGEAGPSRHHAGAAGQGRGCGPEERLRNYGGACGGRGGASGVPEPADPTPRQPRRAGRGREDAALPRRPREPQGAGGDAAGEQVQPQRRGVRRRGDAAHGSAAHAERGAGAAHPQRRVGPQAGRRGQAGEERVHIRALLRAVRGGRGRAPQVRGQRRPGLRHRGPLVQRGRQRADGGGARHVPAAPAVRAALPGGQRAGHPGERHGPSALGEVERVAESAQQVQGAEREELAAPAGRTNY